MLINGKLFLEKLDKLVFADSSFILQIENMSILFENGTVDITQFARDLEKMSSRRLVRLIVRRLSCFQGFSALVYFGRAYARRVGLAVG